MVTPCWLVNGSLFLFLRTHVRSIDTEKKEVMVRLLLGTCEMEVRPYVTVWTWTVESDKDRWI